MLKSNKHLSRRAEQDKQYALQRGNITASQMFPIYKSYDSPSQERSRANTAVSSIPTHIGCLQPLTHRDNMQLRPSMRMSPTAPLLPAYLANLHPPPLHPLRALWAPFGGTGFGVASRALGNAAGADGRQFETRPRQVGALHGRSGGAAGDGAAGGAVAAAGLGRYTLPAIGGDLRTVGGQLGAGWVGHRWLQRQRAQRGDGRVPASMGDGQHGGEGGLCVRHQSED